MLSGEIYAQDKRLKMLDQFKQGKLNIMIATDAAGRGIHVDGVSHVINFTLPEQWMIMYIVLVVQVVQERRA